MHGILRFASGARIATLQPVEREMAVVLTLLDVPAPWYGVEGIVASPGALCWEVITYEDVAE
jgi:hypothetical protein